MKRYIVFGCFIFLSPFALASTWSGKINELRSVSGSDVVLFSLSGDLDEPARCNEWKMYAISLNAPGGRAQYELLRLAYTEEHQVTAESLNTCSFHWKSESVKELKINPGGL